MSSDLSRELATSTDIVAIALHNTERLLHAPLPDSDRPTTLHKNRNNIVAAIDHLETERLDAQGAETLAATELKQAVLWQYYADTARLQFLDAIMLDGTGTNTLVTVDYEKRNTYMHDIRHGTEASKLAVSNPYQHAPQAMTALDYLIHRTLGIAELANALATPHYNHATRQWLRARQPLEAARRTLADHNLFTGEALDPALTECQKEQQRAANLHQDPDLVALLQLLDMAELGKRTYTLKPAQSTTRSVLAFAGLRRRSKPATHHMLAHPSFKAPAPIKGSHVLKF